MAEPGGPAGAAGTTGRRTHERSPGPRAGLTVRITNPDGSTTTLLSYPRDVSAGGVSFLSGTAPLAGTRCTVQLAAADGRRIVVKGAVRWSREEGPAEGGGGAGVRRVGIEFDRPLDDRQLKSVCG